MSSLPFTVQDDLKAKEEYASQQQRVNGKYCGSRQIRLWSVILIIFTATLLLVNHLSPAGYSLNSIVGGKDALIVNDDTLIVNDDTAPVNNGMTAEEIAAVKLKDEISGLINSHQLIVFSKTYCPYSKKAKSILGLYQLKEPLQVVEVNLRDDDYQVKMTLKEISGRETFPNIFLNGETLGGSDDLERLHESGQLLLLLKENQLLSNSK